MYCELDDFESISLSQMEGIKLMRRIDKKYTLPIEHLPLLLKLLSSDYYVQEIKGLRSFEYATLYYDTYDYKMYNEHQNGKLERIKIRTREYIDSSLCFLEIKEKTNKGITHKIRIKRENPYSIGGKEASSFIRSNTPYSPETLEGKLWSLYQRITLVNKARTERITIDYDLRFDNLLTKRIVTLPAISIIEIKKERMSYSPIIYYLNQFRIKPKSLSKYCMGIALTEDPDRIKTNRFKAKLLEIHKITPFQYG